MERRFLGIRLCRTQAAKYLQFVHKRFASFLRIPVTIVQLLANKVVRQETGTGIRISMRRHTNSDRTRIKKQTSALAHRLSQRSLFAARCQVRCRHRSAVLRHRRRRETSTRSCDILPYFDRSTQTPIQSVQSSVLKLQKVREFMSKIFCLRKLLPEECQIQRLFRPLFGLPNGLECCHVLRSSSLCITLLASNTIHHHRHRWSWRRRWDTRSYVDDFDTSVHPGGRRARFRPASFPTFSPLS